MPTRKDTKKEPKKPTATPKERKFLEAYFKLRNKTKAAISAGYAPGSAAVAGHRAMKQLLRKFPDLLDNMGYSVEAVAKNCLLPALTAMKVVTAEHNGKITDLVELVDHPTRLKAADLVLKMHGAYLSKEQINKEASSIRVIKVDMPRPIPPKQLEENGNAQPNGHPAHGEPPKK